MSESAVANVAQLVKHEPDPDVIAALERLLDMAKSGDLIGIVYFGVNTGGWTHDGQAGDTDFSAVLAAFEDWKFRRVWRRSRTDEPDR